MGLTERFQGAPVTAKGPLCGMHLLMLDLSDDDRAALITVMDDPRWTHAAIERVLREEGHRVGSQSVSRHRRGLCMCGKLEGDGLGAD